MNLYGQDMDETVSPLDAGLAWTVDLVAERDFVGLDRPPLVTFTSVSEPCSTFTVTGEPGWTPMAFSFSTAPPSVMVISGAARSENRDASLTASEYVGDLVHALRSPTSAISTAKTATGRRRV